MVGIFTKTWASFDLAPKSTGQAFYSKVYNIVVREKVFPMIPEPAWCQLSWRILNEIYFLPHKLQTREEFAMKSLVPSTLLILPCSAFLPLAKVGKISDQQDHLFQDSLQMGNQTRETTTLLVSLNIVKGLMDPTVLKNNFTSVTRFLLFPDLKYSLWGASEGGVRGNLTDFEFLFNPPLVEELSWAAGWKWWWGCARPLCQPRPRPSRADQLSVPCQWCATVPPRPPDNLHILLRLPFSCRQPLSQVKSQDQTSCQTTQWMAGQPLPLPRHSIWASTDHGIFEHNFLRGRNYQVSAYSATIYSITTTFSLIHLMTAGFCRVSCFFYSSE